MQNTLPNRQHRQNQNFDRFHLDSIEKPTHTSNWIRLRSVYKTYCIAHIHHPLIFGVVSRVSLIPH